MANYHEQIAAMRAERARRERNSQLEEILQNWQEAVQARDQAAREGDRENFESYDDWAQRLEQDAWRQARGGY
jgi:hypothetical protein